MSLSPGARMEKQSAVNESDLGLRQEFATGSSSPEVPMTLASTARCISSVFLASPVPSPLFSVPAGITVFFRAPCFFFHLFVLLLCVRRLQVDGVKKATPLLLCLICIEMTDFVFAVDSIPAVLAISHDTFIVYASNVGLAYFVPAVSVAVSSFRSVGCCPICFFAAG